MESASMTDLPSDRVDRDYVDPKTGIPYHGVDLVYVEHDHDLAIHVRPLWDAAGIQYQCYSEGGGGDMYMVKDANRWEEAQAIARTAQLELEAHYKQIGPNRIVDIEDTESAYAAVEKWNAAGISWHLWAQSAHPSGQAFYFDSPQLAAAAKLIEPITLSDEELADFDAVRLRADDAEARRAAEPVSDTMRLVADGIKALHIQQKKES
jgi:hypothetical protein